MFKLSRQIISACLIGHVCIAHLLLLPGCQKQPTFPKGEVTLELRFPKVDASNSPGWSVSMTNLLGDVEPVLSPAGELHGMEIKSGGRPFVTLLVDRMPNDSTMFTVKYTVHANDEAAFRIRVMAQDGRAVLIRDGVEVGDAIFVNEPNGVITARALPVASRK